MNILKLLKSILDDFIVLAVALVCVVFVLVELFSEHFDEED